MDQDDCRQIATWIDTVIANSGDDSVIRTVKDEVVSFAKGFPLYPEV